MLHSMFSEPAPSMVRTTKRADRVLNNAVSMGKKTLGSLAIRFVRTLPSRPRRQLIESILKRLGASGDRVCIELVVRFRYNNGIPQSTCWTGVGGFVTCADVETARQFAEDLTLWLKSKAIVFEERQRL